jgi:hypothetical protein
MAIEFMAERASITLGRKRPYFDRACPEPDEGFSMTGALLG